KPKDKPLIAKSTTPQIKEFQIIKVSRINPTSKHEQKKRVKHKDQAIVTIDEKDIHVRGADNEDHTDGQLQDEDEPVIPNVKLLTLAESCLFTAELIPIYTVFTSITPPSCSCMARGGPWTFSLYG
ncbi:unnamed protein product, partial [Owenia fusiformis]